MRLEPTCLRAAIKREAEKCKWQKNVGGVQGRAEPEAKPPFLFQGMLQLATPGAYASGSRISRSQTDQIPGVHSGLCTLNLPSLTRSFL